jgi:hypothetical protein
MKWYYEKNGKQLGPVDEAGVKGMLQRGELTAKDLVWKEGMGDWTPAGRVAELASIPSLAGVSAYAESTPSAMSSVSPSAEYGSAPTVFPEVAQRQEEAQKGNPLALVSMIAGILCLLFCGSLVVGLCLALLAIVTGHMSSGKNRKGAGMAKAGLILGYIGLVLSLIVGGMNMYLKAHPQLMEDLQRKISEQAQPK